MTDSDPHTTPSDAVFHGHDVPDRLETEDPRDPEQGEDQGEQSDRARSDDGPHGAGVRKPGAGPGTGAR